MHNSSFEPIDLNLRPHHFVRSRTLRLVLRGEMYPANAAQAKHRTIANNRKAWGDPNGYYDDVLKYGAGFYLERIGEFFRELACLPDTANVYLSIAPDGICKSCAVGRHCTATNYRGTAVSPNIVLSEEYHLKKIRRGLDLGGFEEGTDFTKKTDSYTLVNLQNQPLNSPVTGVLEEKIFEGIVVKARVLRAVHLP